LYFEIVRFDFKSQKNIAINISWFINFVHTVF
jgi:hypothetical protein